VVEMYLMVRAIRHGPDDESRGGASPDDRWQAGRLAGYAEG